MIDYLLQLLNDATAVRSVLKITLDLKPSLHHHFKTSQASFINQVLCEKREAKTQ